MAEDKGVLRFLIDGIKDRVREQGKSMAEFLGPIKEKKSPQEQMMAYKDMTPELWAKLTGEQGVEETADFQREMERRENISESHKRRI
ncbi:hypothetical protein LCGC14_0498510 [marine sediment metagenome]|uniref:Uncharacterized protein n=1 Tax=marine sediment metagenome TaxID=412755 RepID=A0A0F9SN08_9ZZZZ